METAVKQFVLPSEFNSSMTQHRCFALFPCFTVGSQQLLLFWSINYIITSECRAAAN
jgi:hypothetical protein